MKKEWAGERLETFIYTRDAIEHLHRYSLSTKYVSNKVVLDIASGEGYGSNILSKYASTVYGVDIDNEVIEKAKIKYKKENLSFKTGSTDAIPLDDNTIDVVISFETLEHHDKHDEMLSEIKRVLKPDGMIIISTPDKKYYSDLRKFKNKFHVKELYKKEFIDLINLNFKNSQVLIQNYINGNSLIQNDININDIEIHSGNYSDIHIQNLEPLFLIIIASDSDFNPQKTTLFNGAEIVKTEIDNQLNEIFTSTTYKTGKLILKPFQFLKRMIKQ